MRPTLYTIPTPASGQLSTMAHPRGGEWLDDEVRDLREAGVDVLVSLQTADERYELDLTGEREAATRAGLIFRELPIPDMDVPGQREALPLVNELLADVRAGRHVVVHCRAGIGRSSVIAGAVLIALGSDAEEACAAISEARGFRVPETRVQRGWLTDWTDTWRETGSADGD